jgi:hypothetical protein
MASHRSDAAQLGVVYAQEDYRPGVALARRTALLVESIQAAPLGPGSDGKFTQCHASAHDTVERAPMLEMAIW